MSSRCRSNGFISGDMRKSVSVPPLIFHDGGCTPLGLNSVTNRLGDVRVGSALWPAFPSGSETAAAAELRHLAETFDVEFDVS